MPTAPSAPVDELLELEEIGERLDRVLELATADETEVTWIESSGGRAVAGAAGPVGRSDPSSEAADGIDRTPVQRAVLVRAREGNRRGAHRTGSGEPGEILAAVRNAVAASRAAEPLPQMPVPETGATGTEPAGRVASGVLSPETLWDEALARIDPETATQVLRPPAAAARGAGRDELLALDWRLLRVVVRTSSGLDRRAEATMAGLTATVRPGDFGGARAGAGHAAGSARILAGLDPAAILERARERAAGQDARRDQPPGTDVPILFAPEAAAALVAVLVRTAFGSSAFEAERSPIAGMLGEHVFAPEIDLVDHGLDPAGLPFPFDLLGRTKERIELVAGGVPRTPAVDETLAARLRRQPTPHAVGPEDARPTHPFLLPRRSAAEVFEAAEGGLWIPIFDGLECFDRGRVAVRGRCLAPRRVRGGALAEPVVPLIWEDSLLRLFSKVRALGGDPVVLPEDGGLGGVSSPMVCAAGAETLARS